MNWSEEQLKAYEARTGKQAVVHARPADPAAPPRPERRGRTRPAALEDAAGPSAALQDKPGAEAAGAEAAGAEAAGAEANGAGAAGTEATGTEAPDAARRELPAVRAHKFGAIADERHGHHVDSRAEARHIDRLDKLKEEGKVLFYLRQVPFHLPGRTRYVCDFQVFWTDGSITFEDPKGVRLGEFNTRMRLMEETYPWVCVELIGRRGERWPATVRMRAARQVPACLQGSEDVRLTEPPKKRPKRAVN